MHSRVSPTCSPSTKGNQTSFCDDDVLFVLRYPYNSFVLLQRRNMMKPSSCLYQIPRQISFISFFSKLRFFAVDNRHPILNLSPHEKQREEQRFYHWFAGETFAKDLFYARRINCSKPYSSPPLKYSIWFL